MPNPTDINVMEGAKAVRENGCIKTQKGRRITPTPSLLSGFIFSYLRYFFFCLYLNIHTSSFTVASRKRIRISFADGRLLLHNIRFLTKYEVPHISVLNSYDRSIL